MMPPQQSVQARNNPWQKRLRRLFFIAGAVSTIYLLSSYAIDRAREARIRALQEKKRLDLLKSHFTSLLSTLSFTLYALLPTLAPQLSDRFPVERTSMALQGLSSTLSSSVASVDHEAVDQTHTSESTPGQSLLLQHPDQSISHQPQDDHSEGREPSTPPPTGITIAGSQHSEMTSDTGHSGVGESWASEFERRGSEEESVSELRYMPENDEISSTISQAISLPVTDLSSTSGSPPSDMSQSSQLHPSPPRHQHENQNQNQHNNLSTHIPHNHNINPTTNPYPELESKSKKELWRDVKLQSITRAITSAYLLPLLYILSVSQLATLARLRYLHDIKADLPISPISSIPSHLSTSSGTTSKGKNREIRKQKKKGWFSGFGIDAMGLSEFVDESTSLVPNPINLLPTVVTQYLPGWLASNSSLSGSSLSALEAAEERARMEEEEEERMQVDVERAEAERLYLTYSWWILHAGWKGVADRVEESVERVFGGMGLKRELSLQDWDALIREVRMTVEVQDGSSYDFTPHLLPPTPLPPLPTDCPLPIAPPSKHLQSLLSQTNDHLLSPDSKYLLQKGVDAMMKRLLQDMNEECYSSKSGGMGMGMEFMPSVRNLSGDTNGEGVGKRRLVDCLPEITRWGKGVWDGVPDGGVEALLSLPDFENFAALIFGDWAPR